MKPDNVKTPELPEDVREALTPPSDEQLAEIQAKGTVHELRAEVYVDEDTVTEVVFYVRAPHKAHMMRFAKVAFKDGWKASEGLLVDTVLWPSREHRRVLFERWPGLVLTIAGEVNKLGGAADFTVRRLRNG